MWCQLGVSDITFRFGRGTPDSGPGQAEFEIALLGDEANGIRVTRGEFQGPVNQPSRALPRQNIANLTRILSSMSPMHMHTFDSVPQSRVQFETRLSEVGNIDLDGGTIELKRPPTP